MQYQKKDFRAYLVATFGSLFSYATISIASGWQIYALTESASALGMMGLAQFVSAFCMYPIVGQLADQFDRRTIAMAAALLNVLVGLFLCSIIYFDKLSATTLYLAVVLSTISRSLEGPALAAWLPSLVPMERLSSAIAWSSAFKQVAKVSGPVVAGWLLAIYPSGYSVYLLISLVSATAGIASFMVRPHPPINEVHTDEVQITPSKTLQKVFAGARYVLSNRILLGALMIDLLAGLLGGFYILIPVLVVDVLKGDASTAGVLRSAVAVGSFAGAMILALHPIRAEVGRMLILSVAIVGSLTLGVAFAPGFTSAFVLITLLGFFDSVSINIRHSLIQLATPDLLRGRVSATSQLFIQVSNQLGEFRAGLMAAWLGLGWAIGLGGLLTVIIAASWGRLFPSLRQINSFTDVKT